MIDNDQLNSPNPSNLSNLYTIGSLFSGIGAFDLGFQNLGFNIAWQVEIDDFCRKVLTKHWPNVPKYGDIKNVGNGNGINEVNGNERLSPIDILCGGFPCQPVSVAGKHLAQSDERWLWPEFNRIIRLLRPSFVVLENVPGLLSAGMGIVLGDLAESGYDAEWQCVSAQSVGMEHKRDRLFIVAYPTSKRWQEARIFNKEFNKSLSKQKSEVRRKLLREPISYNGSQPRFVPINTICGVADGFSEGLDAPKSIKAYGNAIVVQIVECIAAQILEVMQSEQMKAVAG